MFDIAWTELLLIGVVALIVVGPKDLPGMFRALGRFTAKMRNLAREFQRAMNKAADEAGMSDVASDLKSIKSAKNLGLDAVQDAADRFKGGWKTGLAESEQDRKQGAKAATNGAKPAAAGGTPQDSAPAPKSDEGTGGNAGAEVQESSPGAKAEKSPAPAASKTEAREAAAAQSEA